MALPRGLGVVLLVVTTIGVALRVWQYAANTSLWLDEIALATGIVDIELWHVLTSPLPYDQVAPKGFLLLQKLAITALGPSDYVLRLVPLMSSLVALGAFKRLALRMLGGVGALIAVVLFATGAPLVASGALVKQYSTDVCVAVLLWCMTFELVARPVTPTESRWFAIAGAVAVWCSHPAVLIITAVCPLLAMWAISGPLAIRRRQLIFVIGWWAVSSAAVTVAAFHSMTPATREYMHGFWTLGFPPLPAVRVFDTGWPWDQIRALLGSGPGAQAGFGYPLPALFAGLGVVGWGVLVRHNRKVAGLLIAPWVVTLGAAAMRQYPFSDRLILFLVPSYILAAAAAIEWLRQRLSLYAPSIGTVVAAGFVSLAVFPVAATPPVYRIEHVKALLSHVRARWQDGDKMYVYYGAAPVMTFYASQYGFSRSAFAVGGCHRGNSLGYLKELDTFRGHTRVWLVLTHALPRYREREDILAYLDTIGTRIDGLIVESRAVGRTPLPAEVYLYDLSQLPDIPQGASGPFRLLGKSGADPQFGCGEGPHAMVRADFR